MQKIYGPLFGRWANILNQMNARAFWIQTCQLDVEDDTKLTAQCIESGCGCSSNMSTNVVQLVSASSLGVDAVAT